MIHSSAIIHPAAEIDADCEIGAFCVIGEHVKMGPRNRLHSHVVIDGHTTIGEENEIFPFTAVGTRTQDLKWKGGTTWTHIGDRNTIRENVTIHSATGDGDATVIGSDNSLLSYVHIAHDVTLGSHIIMSNVATLAGHVEVEDNVVISGLAAVHQFCRIGRFAIIGGCSKVVQDVPPFMLADAQQALKKAYKILFRSGLSTGNAIEQLERDFMDCPEVSLLAKFMRASQRGVA